jgi:ATP-dependent RNA helicase SUPV3L1/SUV3
VRRWSKGVAVGDDQVQSVRIKEGVMVDEGPSSEENNLSAAQPQARHDFSGVQGFQVVGVEGHSAPQTARDQAWRDALRLELEARAARFHQAVDSAIVLSNDGIIRWLGDPVARLSLGPSLLNPSAVIFADESLPAASRDAVKTRIELWIAAMTRRILAPLFALEAIREGPELVRNLALELARSLGILEREPIKAQIKALVQNDRAELRKQGVRFGAHYIFVPALIKPAPRILALQLWSLQAPGGADELLRTLGPVASSGRTSLSLDGGISKEAYRVAGYRPCGERIVRVDVVERLAGMIRAAIADEPEGIGPNRPSYRTSKGFVVNGQMTSLTGCSGEQFASILGSLGFCAVEVSRSEFFGSPSANESLGPGESVAPEHQEPMAHDQASSPAACEEGTTTDPVLASPPAAAETLAEGVPLDTAPSHVPADGFGFRASGAEPGAESASPQTSGLTCERAENADMIVVWRPDRRRIHRNFGETESKQSTSATPRRSDTDGRSPAPPKRTRNKRKHALLPSTAMREPPRADGPGAVHVNEKRRQQASECDMPRSNPTTAPQHKAKVDPNSPFAKLLELRPLLEEQANKRP